MDSLAKALERAREEDSPTATGFAGQVESRKALTIEFTQTRSVKLDPAVLRSNRVLGGIEDEQAIAAYKVMRTRVLQKLRANKWNALGVVGARRSSGASLSAINLAIGLAQEVTHSVLLVDFNLSSPGLHHYLGMEAENGIADFLFGGISLGRVLVNPGIDRLVLLPCLETIEDGSEILSSPRVEDLVREVTRRYPSRIVIFDLPPVLEGDEVLSFLPNLDALLLVVEASQTKEEDLVQMSELLKGTPVVGTVLNKARN